MKIPIISNMKHAKATMKKAEETSKSCIKELENTRLTTSHDLDRLGKLEIGILDSFKEFVDLHKNLGITSNFRQFAKENADLPEIDLDKLAETAHGANIVLNSLGGAVLGTVGGFAAYGAITTASLHVAISAIKGGVPIVHLASGATLAGVSAIGTGALTSAGIATGSSFAISSGIIATGTGTALGGMAMSAAGPIGLIVGGTIMSISASKLSKKADKAYAEVLKNKRDIDKICGYLANLSELSNRFYETLLLVNMAYKKQWLKFKTLVNKHGKNPLTDFTAEEQLLTRNLYLLVQLLYYMCQVTLILKEERDGLNILNINGVNHAIIQAERVLETTKA